LSLEELIECRILRKGQGKNDCHVDRSQGDIDCGLVVSPKGYSCAAKEKSMGEKKAEGEKLKRGNEKYRFM